MNADLKKTNAASEKKIADGDRRTQKFEHNQDIQDDQAIVVDECGGRLKYSKEQAYFPDDITSEQRNQLVENDASSSVYRANVVFPCK